MNNNTEQYDFAAVLHDFIEQHRNTPSEPCRNCDLIVTQHPGLVEYFIKHNMAPENTPVLRRAKVSDVKDKDVLGKLPVSLAVYAKSYTEVPLKIPNDLLGIELPLPLIELFAQPARMYEVKRIA